MRNRVMTATATDLMCTYMWLYSMWIGVWNRTDEHRFAVNKLTLRIPRWLPLEYVLEMFLSNLTESLVRKQGHTLVI